MRLFSLLGACAALLASPAAAQVIEVGPEGAVTIDAATEAARLQEMTGGRMIVIQPREDRGFKLPGL